MAELPGKKAFVTTVATSFWIQIVTLGSGILTARLLGPAGRGQFAGAQVWPAILASVALCGVNNALTILGAQQAGSIRRLERLAIKSALLLTAGALVLGWFAMPFLTPSSNPELVSLSRFYLLSVPISLILNNLIAIDHGQGNFWRLNLVRHIFSYAFLVLVSILWFAKIVDVRFFLLAMIIANALVLAYRWNAVSRDTGAAATASLTLRKLFRQGGPFFVTNNVMILNENIERLLLIFLLGPAALGLYVVASTASTAHLNISKALNLVVFARSAGLERERSFVDVARILRKMAIVNLLLSIAMAVALPFLIRLFYGRQFSGAIGAALLLLVAQYFLSQAHVVQEAFRGQSQPFVGLAGVLIGMSVFMCTGYFLALRHGILGVAFSSIFGNISFYSFMLWMLKRTAPSARLWPIRADFAEIYSVIEQGWASVRLRLVRRLERWSP